MDLTREGGRSLGTAPEDQAAAKQTDHSEGYNGSDAGGVRWVRLRDTNTMADAVVNLAHVVRIVQAPGSNFVQVVLRDGSFVDIWEHSTDHHDLLAAIGQQWEVAGSCAD